MNIARQNAFAVLWLMAPPLGLLAACDDSGDNSGTVDAALGNSGNGDGSVNDGPFTTDASVEGPAPDAGNASDTVPGRDASGDVMPLMPGAVHPYNYLKAGDSPFGNIDFAWFYLEDFEDHLFNVPGVSMGGGRLSSSFGGGLIDSVDGDDGIPDDNQCTKEQGTCDAWWGGGVLKFDFDAQALGGLPTHVGVVWTDGEGQVSFEAFGPDGQSLYKFGPFSEPGFPDSTVNSSTSEDRFFGAFSPTGISSITISNTAGGIEVDHLQYGRQR